MKRGLFLYPISVLSAKNNAFDWIKSEAGKFDMDITIGFFENTRLGYGLNNYDFRLNGRIFQLPDFVVMRGYDSLLSRHFENRGILVINNHDSMEISRNKMMTHQCLADAGIKTPKTIYRGDAEYNYEELCDEFSDKKFIVKQIEGSKGENIFLINDESELEEAIGNCGRNCICQEYIKTSSGKDIRVWTIGNTVAGNVLRSSDHSFKSNFSQGGKAFHFDINDEIAALATKSANALGLVFAGIDILFDKNDDYTVCEVNGNAGFRTISSISNESIPYKLFEYISNSL
jgi:gamma-F420-2:alpha-L-glutamate ligase